MSIVGAVKVAEELVLVADSASSIVIQRAEGPEEIGNVFNHTRKLLHLKDYPIGILTWGLGTIGTRSIESLIKEFEALQPAISEKLEHNYNVKAIADELFAFISEFHTRVYGHIRLEDRIPVGLYVGGFSKGYDENIRQMLIDKGLSSAEIDNMLRGLEYNVVFNGMPLQDAIDFAVAMIQLTIAKYRFTIGAPLCGGAIDVAVTTNRYFSWVQRKSWKSTV